MYQISNIYVLAAFGTIGGALFGFDISSMSAWIGVDAYLNYFNHPNSNLQGGITASMSAGSFIAAVIFIIGSVIQSSSQNVAQLVAGRVVNGLAIGVTSSQCCVYLAELAPAKIRGRIVGIQQWSIEWGILIMYLISYGCPVGVSGASSFRIAWGIQAVPAFILLVALFFFPESPRWLASKERWEESLDVLAKIHGNGDRSNEAVKFEFEEVKEAARIANEAKDVSILSLFNRKMINRTLCGLSVQMWQQLLGGNVAMYYVVYIFEMAGMSGNSTLYSPIIQYVIFLVTTGAILPIIDRLGRRMLLLSGAVICGALHYTIAAVMASEGNYTDSVDGNANLRWEIAGAPAKAVIACSYIFVGIYGLTWAPAAWIYCSEVFPLKYRATGVGLSAAVNWIFNFALAYFVAPAFTNIQWRTYIIFGVFCTVMIFHVYFAYPETAQKSLEEIDYLFDSNVKPWRSNRTRGFEDNMGQHSLSTSRTIVDQETKGISDSERSKDLPLHKEQV